MSNLPVAVLAALEAKEAIQRRRHREAQLVGDGMEARRRARERGQQNKALRDEYIALLQGGSVASSSSSSSTGAVNATAAPSSASLSAGERGKALRRMVLLRGLPSEPESLAGGASGMDDACSLRGLVWKLLLGVSHVDAMLYIGLVEQGASWSDPKIRDDTFRTFRGDAEFQRRVPEDKLSRVNNAFVRLNFPDGGGGGTLVNINAAGGAGPNAAAAAGGGSSGGGSSGGGGSGSAVGGTKAAAAAAAAAAGQAAAAIVGPAGTAEKRPGTPEERLPRRRAETAGAGPATPPELQGGSSSGGGSGAAARRGIPGGLGGYVQGMTILCAPLLFVMPEVDAFFAFHALLTRHVPRYVNGNLDGVHVGCGLVDRCLAVVDPALYNYLQSKFLGAAIYAFPLLISLHACVPPLDEALRLWDALFAFGVHLEVLLVVAQCVLLRDRLLRDPNPFNHLSPRYLPPTDADVLLAAAFALIPHIPDSLMDDIIAHPFVEPAGAAGGGGSRRGSTNSSTGGGTVAAGSSGRGSTSSSTGAGAMAAGSGGSGGINSSTGGGSAAADSGGSGGRGPASDSGSGRVAGASNPVAGAEAVEVLPCSGGGGGKLLAGEAAGQGMPVST